MELRNKKECIVVNHDWNKIPASSYEGLKLPLWGRVFGEDFAIVIEKDGTVRQFEDLAKTNYHRVLNHQQPIPYDNDNKTLNRLFK